MFEYSQSITKYNKIHFSNLIIKIILQFITDKINYEMAKTHIDGPSTTVGDLWAARGLLVSQTTNYTSNVTLRSLSNLVKLSI